MEISVLTKFLLRIAKDNDFQEYLSKDYVFKLALFDINLTSLVRLSKRDYNMYRNFFNIVNELFDREKYIINTLAKKNNIVITDINNYDKIFRYLEMNGFMWGSNKRCTQYKPIPMDNMRNSFYLKIYLDEGRIYYGHGYSNLCDDIVFTEDDFYGYYENYKKKLNKVFHKCLKQNYGIFKKK